MSTSTSSRGLTMTDDGREPYITINGVDLTSAQAMTIRVAIEGFAMDLHREGLGSDHHGLRMTRGYLARIKEIRSLIFRDRP